MRKIKKLGVIGTGSIGSRVVSEIQKGMQGYEIVGACDINPKEDLKDLYRDLDTLVNASDILIECLPSDAVPAIAKPVFDLNKTLILISPCALLIHPEILDMHRKSTSRIIIPCGSLAGLDCIKSLKSRELKRVKIVSTKKPEGFANSPYVNKMDINLNQIKKARKLFEGNAIEAAKAFPANVNVAATLAYAGPGPEKTEVEVWADPQAGGNTHEIFAESDITTLYTKTVNNPDPQNPKTSMLAAYSILSAIKNLSDPLIVL